MNPPDYVMSYAPAVLEALGQRQAATSAAFLLPHLRPGMTLLDGGCGPGSITLELARALAPGVVLGLDVESAQFEFGRARARAAGLGNLHFVRGDVRALPLRDGTLDALYLNAVLAYQGAAADDVLGEARRALRPGGVLAVSDVDYGATLLAPRSPALERALELLRRVFELCGGAPLGARDHRARLRAAGFVDVRASARAESCGEPESTRQAGFFWAWFLARRHAALLIEHGLAERAELRALGAALIDWGHHPDAFFVRCRCEALGFRA